MRPSLWKKKYSVFVIVDMTQPEHYCCFTFKWARSAAVNPFPANWTRPPHLEIDEGRQAANLGHFIAVAQEDGLPRVGKVLALKGAVRQNGGRAMPRAT